MFKHLLDKEKSPTARRMCGNKIVQFFMVVKEQEVMKMVFKLVPSEFRL